MPNGKGQLDCTYCKFFQSRHATDRWTKRCGKNNVDLPNLPNHTICKQFSPNVSYKEVWADDWKNRLASQIASFNIALEDNILYVFFYGNYAYSERYAIIEKERLRIVGTEKLELHADSKGDDG